MRESDLREQICEYGRRLYARGFVSANEGNISARLGPDAILATPTMTSKGFLRPDELAVVNLAGEQRGGPKPCTSEIRLHLAIYRHRPDVNAVMHTHAPHATAFAITGTPVPNNVHPELEYFVGKVPTAPYITPGTEEFAAGVVPFLDSSRAVLLANHGLVTFADSCESAWFTSEIVESYCKLLILAKGLGTVRELTPEQVGELLRMKAATQTIVEPGT